MTKTEATTAFDYSLLPTTIDSVIYDRSIQEPNRIAVKIGLEEITFQELVHTAQGFAHELVERGVAPGDRVAIWLQNSTAWVAVQAAIAFAGATAVLVNTRATNVEATHVLRDSEARVVVASSGFLGRDYSSDAQEIVDKLSLDAQVVGVDPRAQDLPQSHRDSVLPGSKPEDTAVLLYTSGTSGTPKGATIRHEVWTNNARLSALAMGLGDRDRVLMPGPLFFVAGSMTSMMAAFIVGADFRMTERYDIQECLDWMRADNTTWFMGVPTMWQDFVSNVKPGEFPSLRGGLWGGAPMSAEFISLLIDPDQYDLNLTSVYGMTEAPSIAVVPGDCPPEKRLTTVGRAGPNIELRIVDEEGNLLAPGEIGGIETRGYHTTAGYPNLPLATEELYRDGWLKTGDLGSVDEEGYLTVAGRMTDMFLVGGSNVYAQEVEQALMQIPGVVLAAVTSMPHERLGEVPIAWLKVSEATTEDEIKRQCAIALAAYKVPKRVFFVEEMPLTATGKIEKKLLKLDA